MALAITEEMNCSTKAKIKKYNIEPNIKNYNTEPDIKNCNTEPDIKLKKTEISDLDELLQWREIVLREVFSISAEENMEELLTANRKYYTSALNAGTHIACFAYVNEKTVGCGGVCFYQEMPSPDNPNGCCAYLMNIYTIPEMRKHGIGKAIVKWLLNEAQKHGAAKIYLEASQKAYPLYKELGFCDMMGYLKYET